MNIINLIRLSTLVTVIGLNTIIAQKKTNIIVILADDMGYSDLGCYGGEAKTPNLDGLAKNGLRFKNFYNNARCCPTRAALISGLYPHQAGVGGMVGNGKQGLKDECVTLAEAVKDQGYTTYMTGKWHVATSKTNKDIHNWPHERGFDKFFGTIDGGINYFNPNTLSYNNDRIKPGKDFYYTQAITDSTVSFLNNHYKQKKDKPFFFYVAYTAPHWPLHALQKDIEKYKGVFDKGWDTLREERLERMKKMGFFDKNVKLSYRDPHIPEWSNIKNKDMHAHRMQTFAAQIDRMDQGIGKIIDKLKQEGEFDNTLIMFMSDNGASREEYNPKSMFVQNAMKEVTEIRKKYIADNQKTGKEAIINHEISYGRAWANLSNTPFRKYKKWGHQGGSATPFIAHWPNGIKGKNIFKEEITSVIDVMPTVVEVSKSTYPSEYNGHKIPAMEGKSLFPIFKNEKFRRNEWFMEHGSNKAYRKGNWKVTFSRDKGDREWELYNLKKDPTELNNLAAKKSEKLEEMISVWKKWATRVKAGKGIKPIMKQKYTMKYETKSEN